MIPCFDQDLFTFNLFVSLIFVDKNLLKGMLVPARALALSLRMARLRATSTHLGPVRFRMAWGEDALGPNVPVGGRMGASENPELHTYDGDYRGSPEKGDKLIPDYFYRTPTMGRTYVDRVISYFISAVLWFWFSYHMYYHSGHIFGHWYMPYLHEFSDEELGIPADSAPDPEYWGNHGKKYGTYR